MRLRNFRGCLLVALICIAHSFHHGQILRNFLSHRIEPFDSKLKTGIFSTSPASDNIPIPSDEDIRSSKRMELLDAIDLYNINTKAAWLTEEPIEKKKKPKGFLGAETRGAETIPISEEGQQIIDLIEALAKYNPTAVPLKGFLGYKEVRKSDSKFMIMRNTLTLLSIELILKKITTCT